jgi:hypothetical protein
MTTTLLATGVIGVGSDHPLLGEFRLRYPGFAGVSDQVVVYRLGKAVKIVDASWADDESDGTMLYAVIQIMKSGAPASGDARAGVTRFRSASTYIVVSEKAANALSDASGTRLSSPSCYVDIRADRGWWAKLSRVGSADRARDRTPFVPLARGPPAQICSLRLHLFRIYRSDKTGAV